TYPDAARRVTSAWPISPPAPVMRMTGFRTEQRSSRTSIVVGPSHQPLATYLQPLHHLIQAAPGFRILTEQRRQIQTDIGGRELARELGRGRRQLRGVGHGLVLLDHSVLVRDPQR